MDIHLDEKNSILHIKPNGPLDANDFMQLSSVLDSYLKQHDSLRGFLVETLGFPGWKNIQTFIAHVKFIKNHHARIQKIALVTNSKFADVGKLFISHFVRPCIKHFPYGQVDVAKQWILEGK